MWRDWKINMAVAFAATLCLLTVACGKLMNDSEKIARNCQRADEGAKLFRTYSRVLRSARDWEKVGWQRQVPITKWLACRHKLPNSAPVDDCLDHLAYDEKAKKLPIIAAIDRCIAQAQQKQAK